MSNVSKALLVLGAIGGFLLAILYIPGALEWTFPIFGFITQETWFLYTVAAFILITIGFLGLWGKSGNPVPLVSALFILLQGIIGYLLFYLWWVDPASWPDPESLITIVTLVTGVGWLAAGISAWLLREEFSQFSIVAALVFLVYTAVGLVMGLLYPSEMLPLPVWFMWLISATSIVTGIYFLDAART